MAKSTNNNNKKSPKRTYKSVTPKERIIDVVSLSYSERKAYLEEHYVPFISDANMIFTIWNSGFDYDMFADNEMVKNQIINHYQSIADYTEESLPIETVYTIRDWDLIRRDIDPETDDVIDEVELEQISSDNTYNFSYRGLVDLNWRVYYDEEFERYFYVIMPHLGGDIRGNYGDAIILEGNDKEELFYRFFENFISGGASVYLKFIDGSEISFDSEQDSDVFYFRVSESFEPTGMAQKYLNDFQKFDSWQGDEFLEETVQLHLMRSGIVPKMMSGGRLDDETPRAYFQILGYDEGMWVDLSDYSDGTDLMDYVYSWMKELNEKNGGNREEYAVHDYEGFGYDLYDEYMGVNEFDEIIEAYDKFKETDFPSGVINTFIRESGSGKKTLYDSIETMTDSFLNKYDNYSDFGYDMVNERVYTPSFRDVYITDTDKRIISYEEADNYVSDFSEEELIELSEDAKARFNTEQNELEDSISNLESEIEDLKELASMTDDDDEYAVISNEVEEKEIEIESLQESLESLVSKYSDEALEEVRNNYYDELYDKLENNLEEYLDDMGISNDDLSDISFLSIDYESIGEDIAVDYLVIEYNGDMYFFYNYEKGGRLKASVNKPKYEYYIVENSTKKLVSGYNSKQEAVEQRKLLIKEFPSLRFEIYTLGNLESKTELDVYDKNDYVKLSTLDKIKKVSVDTYRYGKEKSKQANEFLIKHDVKGKIKRGGRRFIDKTKEGGNWLKKQWEEADFGDGKGKAKFFDEGGYLVLDENDKYYNQIGFASGDVSVDKKGVQYITLDFGKGKGISTYSLSDLKRQFFDGGVIEEIKTKYQIAGSNSSGVYTYSKWVADEIAEKYNGDVQEDGSYWYVRLEQKYYAHDGSTYANGGGVGKYKVGDRVTDVSYSNGSGEIVKILEHDGYVVQFDRYKKGDYRNISGWDIVLEDKYGSKYENGGGVDYRGRDIDKIKVGDIVKYANSNTEYEAKVLDIEYDNQFKGMSNVQIEWLDNGKIQSAFLKDLMLSNKRFANGGEIEKLNLTELETKILRYFLSQLNVNELGYSATSVDDIANGINVNINSVKGSVGSLSKKRIIYVEDLGEGIGTIVYLQDGMEYLHPEYKDYIEATKNKFADGGELRVFSKIKLMQDYGYTYDYLKKLSRKEADKLYELNRKDRQQTNSKFANGGGVGRERFNLSFNYNPSNISNEDAEKIVEQYTNDWKHDNDFDNVSFYVFNLTKEKADELKALLKMEDVVNIEIQKSDYANGGGVEEDLKNQINQLKGLYNQIKNNEIPNESGMSLSEISDEIQMLQYQLDHNKEYANGGVAGLSEITKGVFKGFYKFKNKIVIPLNVPASNNGLDSYKMPKFSVAVGFELAKNFSKMSYDTFNLAIKDDEIVLLLTPLGQRIIKVNVESNNYTLQYFIDTIKQSVNTVLNRYKSYADGGGVGYEPMNRYDKITYFMNDFGFDVDDIQATDFSVGISDGWVVFKKRDDKNEVFYSISYDNVWYYLHHNGTKEDILNDSQILDDDYFKNGGDTIVFSVGDSVVLKKSDEKGIGVITQINDKMAIVDFEELGKTEVVSLHDLKKIDTIYSNGGDVLTKPKPTTKPSPTTTPTTRPDKDNPYKPKAIPRPKAGSVDFILMKNN